MGYVTNIIITGYFNEKSELLKEHLKKFTEDCMEFMWVNGSEVGGNKCLESNVLIGAFHYMNYGLFCEVIHELKDFLNDFVFENIQVIIRTVKEFYRLV